MKAIRVGKPGGLDNLYLDSCEGRAPEAGEVTVKLHASSLNFHDYMVAIGKLPTADGRIPMSDGAGEVVAVGAGVEDFQIGDRVIGTFFLNCNDGLPRAEQQRGMMGDRIDGYAREQITLPAYGLTHAPEAYSHAEAATLPCAALTAWRALVVNGAIRAGQTVLVQGTGGVSVFALQFAKAAGAKVIATSSSDEKLERLKAMGADGLINYKTHPNWGEKAFALSDGGVDHVVEVGGAGTLAQSMAACGEGAHIGLIGVLAGIKSEIPSSMIMFKQLRVQGVMVGSRQDQKEMVRAINAHAIRPVMDKHFELPALAQAFRYQESGAHFGKIIVDIT